MSSMRKLVILITAFLVLNSQSGMVLAFEKFRSGDSSRWIVDKSDRLIFSQCTVIDAITCAVVDPRILNLVSAQPRVPTYFYIRDWANTPQHLFEIYREDGHVKLRGYISLQSGKIRPKRYKEDFGDLFNGEQLGAKKAADTSACDNSSNKKVCVTCLNPSQKNTILCKSLAKADSVDALNKLSVHSRPKGGKEFPSCYAGPKLVYTDTQGKCLDFASLQPGQTFLYKGKPVTYDTQHSGTFAEMAEEQAQLSPGAEPSVATSQSNKEAQETTKTSGKSCSPVDENGIDCVTPGSPYRRHSYSTTEKTVDKIGVLFTNSCDRWITLSFTSTHYGKPYRGAVHFDGRGATQDISCLSDYCANPIEGYTLSCN